MYVITSGRRQFYLHRRQARAHRAAAIEHAGFASIPELSLAPLFFEVSCHKPFLVKKDEFLQSTTANPSYLLLLLDHFRCDLAGASLHKLVTLNSKTRSRLD